MYSKLGALLLLIPICSSQTDRWVWGDGKSRVEKAKIGNNERRYNGELASYSKPLFQANSNYNNDRPGIRSSRYEVTESYPPDYNTYRPRPPEYYKPDSSINRPVGSYKPPTDFSRPTSSLDNYRPIRPHENEYRPIGNGYRPPNNEYTSHGLRPGVGTNGRPILTGPTPSWEEDGHLKYKDYNVCKCVHSFNCNTPGIKFGSCDTDKQYCCYKSKQNENFDNSGKPSTNFYEKPPLVLAGPGGPVDRPGRPFQNKERPYRPDVNKYTDPEKELNEAYKKGLESAIYELHQRPTNYYDRDPQGYREYYQTDKDNYKGTDNYKTSHISKYGLYDPSVNYYARSSNSSIPADN